MIWQDNRDFNSEIYCKVYVPPPVEDDDPAITYTGVWSELSHPAASAERLTYSDQAYARAELSFYGSGVRWFVGVGRTGGMANVYLDDAYLATVDLYRPHYKLTMLEKAGLHRDVHTVAIEVAGERNPNSSGYYVDIDAFEVLP